MGRFRFEAGTEYRQDGKVYRMVDLISVNGESSWLVKRLSDGVTITITPPELERLYATNALERHGSDAAFGEAAGAQAKFDPRRHDHLSAADIERRTSRKKFIELVERQISPGCKTAALPNAPPDGPKNFLAAAMSVCAPLAGLKQTPSQATFYRWRAAYDPDDSSTLVGNFAGRGNRLQVEPMVREAIMATFRRRLDNAVDVRSAGGLVAITGQELISDADTAVDVLKKIHSRPDLKRPCQATLYSWWNSFPALQRDTVKFGPAEARKRYRMAKGHAHPEIALDEAEYDETKLPFFFYDEHLGIPLGRSTLSWFLCTVSHSVLGWYNGFEGAGDLAMTSAARHMCTPKTYVAEEYPQIKLRCIQHGIPRMIKIDNSKTAWGETAKQLCPVLDTDWDWCPARTPYFKPIVEGMFDILNDQLLQRLPGYVLPLNGIYGDDYDPAKNAVLGIRHFQLIFHAWLIDYYHPNRQRRLGASPNEKFAEGIAQIPAGLLDRASDLRLAFGIVREGRLDHRGVVYEGLEFRGDALQALRHELGAVQRVVVKVDPSDLRSVYVRHPKQRLWIEVPAVRQAYAKGRTLHQHLIIRKFEREHYGTDGERAMEAQRALAALISSVVDDAQNIRRNSLVARFAAVGTDSIFSNLDHDGKLHPLTGPFLGQRLNPMLAATEAAERSKPPALATPSAVLTTRAAIDAPVAAEPTPASQRPAKKVYKADFSLLKKRNRAEE